MTLKSGDTILNCKYRVEELVGRGAFGEVYHVTHLALGASRALKMLRRDAPGVGSGAFALYRERFKLDARRQAAGLSDWRYR